MYKLQIREEDNETGAWHNVHAPEGGLLLFEDETDARSKLAELFSSVIDPVQCRAGNWRTRVCKVVRESRL